MPNQSFHANEIYISLEVCFNAYRQSQNCRSGFEAIFDHIDTAKEISASSIKLVNKAHPGNTIAVSLTPYSLRSWLDTSNAIKYSHGAVKHPHRALNFDGKIYVAGRIDYVNFIGLRLFISCRFHRRSLQQQ